jgi:hypothetical protein
VAVTVRQNVTGFAGAGVTTVTADFTGDLGACLAGSLILFVVGGDKNSGTFTPPSDCPNVPVDLRLATGDGHVSLMMAWGTADGGETVISGTIGANTAGSQVWALELVDDTNTGAWGVRASATRNTDGTAVQSWSTGTTGAATAAGLAVAAIAADSVNTAGTPTWSSSTGHTYTSRRTTASGGGQAGLWGATADVASGQTTVATLDRGGTATADQHSGAVLVFSRAAAAGTTGAVAGSSPRPSGALAGQHGPTGALAGSSPRPVGALAGQHGTTGAVAGSSPYAAGALAGVHQAAGTLAGSSPRPSGALTGSHSTAGAVAGSSPRPVGALAATATTAGQLAGSAPWATGQLAGLVEAPAGVTFGVVLGTSPYPGAALVGDTASRGELAGLAPPAGGELAGEHVVTGAVAGTTAPVRGTLTDYVPPAFVRPLRAGTVGATIDTAGPAAGLVLLTDDGPVAGAMVIET